MEALITRSMELAPRAATVLYRMAIPLVLGITFAVFLQFGLRPAMGPYYEKILMDVGINIILAVSLNMVNGFTGQFSIGHAGFMAVGGYAAGTVTYYGSYYLWNSFAQHGGFIGSGELLFFSACLFGGLCAALAGFVVGLPSLRLRGDYLAIVTLGFGEILRVLLQQTGDVLTDGEKIRALPIRSLFTQVGGALGFNGIPFYTSLFWVYISVALVLWVAFRLKFSSSGRAFLSIREDEIAAEAMGVPTTRLKVRAFVFAVFFAGIAGALFAHEVGTTLNPRELGFQKSFDIIIMVVLGGMGSVSGLVIAAVLLTLLPEVLRSVAEYRMVVYALLLILMMIVRPQGFFGTREIWGVAAIEISESQDMSEVLCMQDISLSFGGLKAVADFNLKMFSGDLQALIGPNGAGKTTVFNLLTGVYRPQKGSITLAGKDLQGLRPFQITAAGMARTFQNIRIFQQLSVLDNVRVGCYLRGQQTFLTSLFRTSFQVGEERAMLERARALLEFFDLIDRQNEQARNLSYGDQRRLEIARALATDPKVLLLDEPTAGMNRQEKQRICTLIATLREKFGLTILLIEHDMGVVMDLCKRITVLDYGVIIAQGTPQEIQNNPRVIEAYLGVPEAGAETCPS